MEAIVNYDGRLRRQAIIGILVEISQRDAPEHSKIREPVQDSVHARNIIQAAVVSFEDYREKVQLYKDIADLPYSSFTLISELKFTAATLAFDTNVEGDDVFPKHVDVFTELFMMSSVVTVGQLAGYWHCRDKQSVCNFISKKCLPGPQPESQHRMINHVLHELRLRGHQGKYDSHMMIDRQKEQYALPMIVSELAHKRVNQMTPMGQIDLILSQGQ